MLVLSIEYKLKMTNGDTFYIKANEDIDEIAMWITKNSNGHGFTVTDDNGTYIRIRDIVSIEQCDKQSDYLKLQEEEQNDENSDTKVEEIA